MVSLLYGDVSVMTCQHDGLRRLWNMVILRTRRSRCKSSVTLYIFVSIVLTSQFHCIANVYYVNFLYPPVS